MLLVVVMVAEDLGVVVRIGVVSLDGVHLGVITKIIIGFEFRNSN